MENKNGFEQTMEILKDNINRILNEKDRSVRWLSIKIGKNDWYITRMLNGKIDPSLDTLFHIAEALRVELAELFTKKEG